MRVISLIFLCLFIFACSANEKQIAEKKAEAEMEREVKMLQFQEYVDYRYPNWKVAGFNKDGQELDGNAHEKNFYYLILTNGEKERFVFVAEAQFELADGKMVTKIYQPSKEAIKQTEEKKLKEKGVEEEQNKYADYEPPEPF